MDPQVLNKSMMSLPLLWTIKVLKEPLGSCSFRGAKAGQDPSWDGRFLRREGEWNHAGVEVSTQGA